MHIAAILGLVVGKYGFFSDMIWLNEVGHCDSTVSEGMWPQWRDMASVKGCGLALPSSYTHHKT